MKFDLVVAGGEVLDPGAGLRGVMDSRTTIKDGRIWYERPVGQ